MQPQNKQQLYKRYTNAKGDWDNWRSIYDEAYAFAIPDRDPWPEIVAQGWRKNIQCYDLTAVISTNNLAAALHANLTPPGQQWFVLEAGSNITDSEAKKELNGYLQHFTDIIFQELYRSNFELVINECYQDLCIGTCGMMIVESDERDALFTCKATPMNLLYPEANAFDQIETIWRDFNDVYIRDITRLWPKAKIPEELTRELRDDVNAKCNLTEGVVYDHDADNYRVVVFSSSCEELILDIRVKSSPWVVARWSKASNEVGGRGPVIFALPTIRSANALTETILRNAELATSPPWLAASDSVFNPYLFQIEPNKVIPVNASSMINGAALRRLDVSSDINTGTLTLQDLRMQIKECLFDEPVRPVDAPPQTATEVMIRQQKFLERIGPAFGRLSVELLPPIINRVIYILQRKGVLPRNLNIDNKNIQIRYQSPLVKAAALQKVQNLQNYTSIMQAIAGGEITIGSLNLEMLPQFIGDQLDVAEELIKSPAQITQMVQQAAQAQQQTAAQQLPNASQQLARPIQTQQALGGSVYDNGT